MDALLKRREELIRAKQEIERKLKLAGKVKGKGDKIKTLTTINEDETNDNATEFAEPRNDSIILDMKWDNKTGKLAVLQPQTLQIKSLKNSDTTRTNLVLPETADKDTELVLENGAIGVCYKTRSYVYQNDKWKKLDNDQKLISSSTNTVTLNRAVKKIQIFKCDEVLHEIDDVEIVFKSEDVSSHKDNILILKSDGSLTFCDLRTFDETVYLPHSITSHKSSFSPKHIVYYNHDTDATLFLVLYDQVVGKLRVLVCGVDQGGSTELASISIPKDNLFLKVVNPFILYQDSKHTVHILSLFTLAEETKFDLDHRIQSFCILNSNNFVFLLKNGEFIHFNL